jgi:hypothetical protein
VQIGYMRVSKADGSQALGLQRDALLGTPWRCSWRHAGGVVAGLRCSGDYLDWYCSTGEGLVDVQVLAEFSVLGWELAEAEPPE